MAKVTSHMFENNYYEFKVVDFLTYQDFKYVIDIVIPINPREWA